MVSRSGKPELVLGNTDSDFLRVKVVDYAFHNARNPWSANWLECHIVIRAGSFSGEYKTNIRNVDFRTFKDELDFICDKPAGRANFNSFEDYLEVRVEGNGLGHYMAVCRAKDSSTIYGNKLIFLLRFEQADIPGITEMIATILDRFPVIES